MSSDIERLVLELANKKEIEELITWRFARAIDWIDVESAKECFHSDGRFAYDDIEMNAHDFVDAFSKSAGALKMRSHNIGPAAVALNGDKASGEAYAIFAATRENADTGALEDYVVSCRYLSELEKRAGVWKMSSLRIVFDWSFGQPATEVTPSGNRLNRGLDTSSPLFRRLDPRTR